MEGKRPGILFLLLVTLSSVMGKDFTFTKEAYDATIKEECDMGFAHLDVQGIKFLNTKNNEVLLLKSDHKGVIDIEPETPEAVKTAISGIKNQGQTPLILSSVAIGFGEISHNNKETTFGYILTCFRDRQKKIPEQCVTIRMFSPAQNPEDIKYAKQIAKEVNPLSKEQVQKISNKQPFEWSLSSLKEVISDDLKAVVYQSDLPPIYRKNEPIIFVLKPIIVDEKLLRQYFDLATRNSKSTDSVN